MAVTKTFHVVRRNPSEELRFTKQTFKGHDRYDVRLWFRNDEGEWRPTKRGVSLHPEIMDEAANAISAMRKDAEAEA